MSSNSRDHRRVTADIGWRVSQLRIRRGISQNEIARRTGKHTSFISRVERPDARRGVPKRETVEDLLDAIGATAEERAAVFQIESEPQTPSEIARLVAAIREQFEETDSMVVLLDAHWVRRYISKSYRRLVGLTDSEHERVIGEHVLLSLVDPSSPMYSRYADGDRLREFSMRAALFKLRFAEHQFDSWYLDLENRLIRFPHVESIWDSLPVKPTFADQQDILQRLPDGTVIELSVLLRQMYDAPRFTLLEVKPSDARSAAEVEQRLRR